MDSVQFLNYASRGALLILTLSLLFPMYRLFRGPSLTDRILALDQIELIIVAMILCYAVITGNKIYMDVVLITSFLLALGAMIITRYLFKRRIKNG